MGAAGRSYLRKPFPPTEPGLEGNPDGCSRQFDSTIYVRERAAVASSLDDGSRGRVTPAAA
jgi:hypothetical protein